MSVGELKASLRAAARAQVAAFPPTDRPAAARSICAHLTGASWWRSARSVMLFYPLPDEAEVSALIALALNGGKAVALPRFDANTASYQAAWITDPALDLVTGRFQVREPAPGCPLAPLNQLDLVLVPGVAFDASGRRLGRGKGYYDRMLTAVRGTKCGVAFECQIIAEIPAEPHDVKVDCLVTESRLLEFPPAPRL